MPSKLTFETLLDFMPDAVVAVDREGLITLVNTQTEQMFGYSLEELIGEPIEILVPERFRKRHVPDRSGYLAAPTMRPMGSGLDLYGRRKDGSEFPVEISLAPAKTDDVSVVLSVIHDITARKQAEEIRSRLSAIVESSDDAIIGVTLEGMIQSWNRGAERLYGYSAGEVLGQPITRLVPPDRLDEIREILNKIRRGEVTEHLETVRRHKDGRDIHVSLTVSAVKDSTGQLIGASGIARDITERKQMEEKLAAEKELLSVTLHSIGDGVITTDIDGKILAINKVAGEITGWPQAEAMGRPLHEVFHIINELTRERCESPFEKIIRTGRIVGLANHTVLIARDATERILADSGAPIRDNTGHIVGVVLIFRDVTDLEEKVRDRTVELREMVERLEEMDRLKSEFLSNISHELRTPLTSIIGFSEILLDQTPGVLNQTQMEYIQNMFHSGHNLLEIISNLLDISKIRAGKMEVHPGLFQLQHLINTAKMTVTPLMEKKGIHLDEEIDEGLPEIYADEGKIKQVLLNLLSNAIKFTAEGGTVKITARTVALGGESFAEISVADTGIGIRQEDLGIIFDEFRQVDASYTKDYPGTGLGLPITKHLVEMNGGRIWVESEPGRGATFTFALPMRIPVERETGTKKISAEKTITRPPITAVKIEEGPVTEDAREGAPTILVVEDDRQACQLITYYLTQEGYQVVLAYDGEEAIQKARELKPFAITLDIMLPRKDGWHVLQELKSMPETKDIPVIILSMVENRELGFSLGATDYLMKPFDRTALLNSLAKLGLEGKARYKPVTILVVEHNPQMLEDIKGILAETKLGVISASEIEEGITLALEGRPDIILLGLTSFSDQHGLDLPHRLMKYPIIKDIPIIVYLEEELSREMEEKIESEIRKIIHYKGKSIREDLLFEIKKYEKLYPDKARMIDGLTGLYNERYMRSRLADEVGRTFRYKRTFSLIVANIDHFRDYNERNGMEKGDKALRNIADSFKKNLRLSDSVTRRGGSTFIVLMAETIKRPAILVAEKLRRLVESLAFPGQDGQVKEHLTISVGVATFVRDAKTGEGIIDKALNALEKAKREGGNRVVDAAITLNEENHS